MSLMFQIRRTPLKSIVTAEHIGTLQAKVTRLKRKLPTTNSEGGESDGKSIHSVVVGSPKPESTPITPTTSHVVDEETTVVVIKQPSILNATTNKSMC